MDLTKNTVIEQQRARLESAVGDMIDDLYKSHLRKMQGQMHLCAARCCDDTRGTLESVQNCVESCSKPLIRAQDVMAHELGQFQGRMQHCVMQCNDDARNKLPSSVVNDSELTKYQYQFERCTVKCVDKHIALIPQMMKSIKNVLDNNKPERNVSSF